MVSPQSRCSDGISLAFVLLRYYRTPACSRPVLLCCHLVFVALAIRGGFFISAWAYSFPLAAMTIASFAMAKRSGFDCFHWIAAVLLAIVSFVVVVLIAKTLGALRRHAICVPE